jgi:DNA-binding GntR family transcriptional regulator
VSLTDEVYAKLKGEIVQVVRRPGEVVYEAELAAEFGVSKTPVREALRLLAHTGWIVVLPRRGYLVRPVELRDIRDIFAIRRMVEPTLAAEAATAAMADDVAALESVLAQQSQPDDEGPTAALDAARRFHLALADVAGSHRVHSMLSELVDEVRRLHYLLPNVAGHITSAEELRAHTLILEAVRARDAEKARALMTEHLNEVAHALVKGFAGG